MTRKKIDNPLALSPLASSSGSIADSSLAPWHMRRGPTDDQKRLIETDKTQRLVINLTAAKACLGANMIGTIHRHGAETFANTTECIMEIRQQQGRSRQHQAYIDQFSERQTQLLAQHMLAAIQTSAIEIGAEMHNDPSQPKPARRAGLLERLFGK